MGRNVNRDVREAERRRNQLINAGFELFSAHGIDAVSLQAVAYKADVGTATMYNYFQNKQNLVIAISTKIWGEVWDESMQNFGIDALRAMNAYELIERYCNSIIQLYKERPDILRFSSDFKTYVCREGVAENKMQSQLSTLEPISTLFYQKYEEAKSDQSIRTDLEKHNLFASIALPILCMAERYAQGIVWANSLDGNHLQELLNVKEMLLLWVRG